MANTSTQNLLAGDLEHNENKYLSFFLGEETFAVSILQVKEIIEYGDVRPVPMMPEFIRGAINLRGHVVPIVDLSLRLGNDKIELSRRTCIIIVELIVGEEHLDVGLIVDAVSKVLDVDTSTIERAPSFGGQINTDFIEGMGKCDDQFVIVLNVRKILTMDDLKVLATAQNLGIDAGSEQQAMTSE
jgi:purine-binding chemotaxis protein CheW